MIAGFDLHTRIYESARVVVTRGIRLADNLPVVVKRLRPEAQSPQNRARLAGEFRILQRLAQDNVACVLRPVELLDGAPGMALVSYDIGAVSLRAASVIRPFSVQEVLTAALEVCRALSDLHTAGLVHKQISPDTVVINRDTGVLQLIDFSLAADDGAGVPALESLLSREAQAQYMSPEQTGRLNRPVDARSDYYSLGVTLYELLTQQRPFHGTDVTQLIYQILATVPPHVSGVAPRTPAAVGDIVHKLLEKIPEQRYQSALGIAHDVSYCLQQLAADGRIKPFRLASEDRSMRLETPRRLYGRERELEVLHQAYSRVLLNKTTEVVLLRGPSGCGKSALVAEFAYLAGLNEGLFAVGKHEEARRQVPFSGINQATNELVRQVMREPAATLAEWRQHLRDSLGTTGQPLVQMVPALELLLGVPPTMSQVETIENEHRLLLAWRRLFEAFAAKRPVVLFLDDLQWADGGTRRLLASLLRDAARTPGLLLILAVRDADRPARTQEVLAQVGIADSPVVCKELSLGPMSRNAVQELIEAATQRSGESTRALADWLHRLTGGNPFFVREGLKHLSRKQLIVYRVDEGRWVWNMEEIAAAQVPDDVAALLLEKLLAVDESQRRLLGYAACLGNEISLDLLRNICSLSRAEALVRLASAVESGILLPSAGAPAPSMKAPDDVLYRFAHDRIRQTAYDLLPPEDALAFHYSVVRYFLQTADMDHPEDWVFSVIGHVNAARPLVRDPEELRVHAQLNLVAARAAKNAATYSAGSNHIAAALGDLPPNAWDTDYPLMLQLSLERIENEFLQGDVQAANDHILEALDHVRTPEQRAEVLRLRVICQAEANQYQQALATGGAALSALGINWGDMVPSRLSTSWLLRRVHRVLRGQTTEILHNMPRIEDSRLLCALRILDSMVVPAFYTHGMSLAIVAATMVRLTLKHGSSPFGAFSFAALAAYWARIDRFDRARQCAFAAHALLQQQPDTWQRSKTIFVVNLFVDVLRHHPVEQTQYADTLQEMLLQDGALVYAGLNLLAQVQGLTMLSLAETLDKVSHYRSFVHLRNTPRLVGWLNALRQTCLCLSGKTASPSSFTTADYDEDAEGQQARRNPGDPRSLGYWFGKVLTLWVHRHPLAARNAVVEAARAGIIERSSPQTYAYVSFFMCLSLIAHARELALKRVLDGTILRRALRRMRAVVAAGPEILSGLPRLIDAELAALAGRKKDAIRRFETALPELERSGYLAAIAAGCECAGRFYLEVGLRARAQASLSQAHQLYQRWGASVKVRMLDEELHSLFGVPKPPGSAAEASEANPQVDVPALMQATQALLEIDDAKTKFFANISHELRTPLTLILGPLEALLTNSSLPAVDRQQLQLCQRNGLRLLSLVDDLLTLARHESAPDNGSAHLSVINVLELLNNLTDLVRPWAQRKQVQLVSELPSGADILVQADARELECVILNLLGNAVKFTPHDGRIVLRMHSRDHEIKISVTDTGVGISPDVLPHLFERFYRGQHSSESGGTGLGLALCKKIVEKHGGRITAESVVGQGTTFAFYLPQLHHGVATPPAEQDWHQSLRTADDYRLRPFGDIARDAPTLEVHGRPGNALILVVDDNPDMLAFVTSVMETEYEVCTASDGLQGLHAARELRPDLIITDVGMPGLSGLELTQRLRADRHTWHIPIVLLTAHSEVNTRIDGQARGVDAHLAKPFVAEELRYTARNLLKKQSDQRDAGQELRNHELRLVVAGVSHEILNPLGFIRSAVFLLREAGEEALKGPQSPAKVVEVTHTIREAARAADEGVQRVRHAVDELRRFGSGGPQAPLVPMPLATIVENIQRLAGHEMRLVTQMEATRRIKARAGQLEQVLLNLVVNAHRAAGPQGEICLRTWDDPDGGVCLSVSDNGPGIDAMNLERIFQPFFTTKPDGAGLGLSISRQIVREHGGDLRANSVPGKGSTFVIRLPTAS